MREEIGNRNWKQNNGLKYFVFRKSNGHSQSSAKLTNQTHMSQLFTLSSLKFFLHLAWRILHS